MAQVRIVQNNFTGGILSPALYGRHDIAAYYRGAADIVNFVVLKTGGVRRRRGIVNVLELEAKLEYDEDGAPEDNVLLVPYHYDHERGGVIMVRKRHGYTNLYLKYESGMEDSWGSFWNRPENDIEQVLTATMKPSEMAWMQVGDTVYLSGRATDGVMHTWRVVVDELAYHNTYLSNSALSVYRLGAVTASEAPHYVKTTIGAQFEPGTKRTYSYAAYAVRNGIYSPAKTARASVKEVEWPSGGKITITVRVYEPWPETVVVGKRAGAGFGEVFRADGESYNTTGITDGKTYRSYSFIDENHMPGELVPIPVFLFGEGVQPAGRRVAMYQQRLVLAGLKDEPFSLVFSRVGDFYNFVATRPSADDDPFRVTLPVESYMIISHVMTVRDALLVFTAGGVWRIYAGSQAEGFSARTCRIELVSEVGCSDRVAPVVVVNNVFFVGADEQTVYELRYDLQQDMLVAVDRTILARHLVEGTRIVSMAYQRYSESVLWLVGNDGRLLSLTVEAEHEVWAWARHETALRTLRQVVALRSSVKLAVSGFPAANSQMIFLGRVWNEEENYEDESVRYDLCKWDYGYERDGIGDAGADYESSLVTLRPETPERNTQGMPKRVADCLVRVLETRRLGVVSQAGGVDAVVEDAGATKTGNVKLMPRGVIDEDGQMKLIGGPGPCEVQCIVWKLEIGE